MLTQRFFILKKPPGTLIPDGCVYPYKLSPANDITLDKLYCTMADGTLQGAIFVLIFKERNIYEITKLFWIRVQTVR